MKDSESPGCAIPLVPGVITMAHGGGGRAMGRLLDEVVLRHVRSVELEQRHDSAVLELGKARAAFTTDSYVVRPRFFPGGDIGRLSVFGTVNDLAMAGAVPAALSLSLILEEGFSLEELGRVTASIQAACDEADVRVVTGDTKVVDRGKGDGLYITTSGVGLVPAGVRVAPDRIAEGDAVIVSGDLGRHGMAILGAREHLGFEPPIESDCAPLAGAVAALLAAGMDLHVARDLTRGGLAAALCELSVTRGANIEVQEGAIPVSAEVAAACELLGLDPMHVACEGRMVLMVPAAQAEQACSVLRRLDVCKGAVRIGTVTSTDQARVEMRTRFGGRRIVDLPSGEQLPRIC